MSDKNRTAARAFLLCFFSLLLVGAIIYSIRERGGTRVNERSRESLAMDTIIRVSVNSGKTPEELDRILDGAFELIAGLDDSLSMHKASSDISRVNANAGQKPVKVAPRTAAVLWTAAAAANLTDGAFDVTIGPVTALWQIRDAKNSRLTLPGRDEIEDALSLVGADMMTVSADNLIYLKKEGMKLDLGGIAKGFAASETGNFLAEAGIESALIDLGGDVLALGSRPNGAPWRIGIQHPYRPRGEPICSITVNGASVITAGVYERFIKIGGKRYPHIFDPRTGRPIEGSLLSATVVTDDPTTGDALATAFMTLGLEKSKKLLESLPGVEAIFVSRGQADDEPELYVTSGIKGLVKTDLTKYTGEVQR
ncbi:MAG: FAD:protein FMN transferase [Synergistaceae bacterium]|nr:FAD:protein FMN transferase [Synergistaceae bacterium]